MKKFLRLSFSLLIVSSGIFFFFNKKDQSVTVIPKKDRPDLAALHEFEMTKDPALGIVPSERKVAAFQEVKKRLQDPSLEKAIENVSWTERGPYDVGGRTRAIIFDPNDPEKKKVWAGGVGGGLWYNTDITDPNTEWINVDDFMANLSISWITHDPTNTQVFYMGTGMGYTGRIRGAGIWKSTDAGATWNQLKSTTGTTFKFVNRIAVNNNGRVFAGTSTGLFYSDDQGDTWENSLFGGVSDLEIASNGTLYVGLFGGKLRKSTNNGESWLEVTPTAGGDRVELTVSPSDPETIYAIANNGGSVAWFRKSSNGGTTWTNVTIPRYYTQSCAPGDSDFTRGQAWFDLTVEVHPEDPEKVLLGGIDLYTTNNSGVTWSLISYWTGACKQYVHADQHFIGFRPGHSAEAVFGNDGGVFYSENAGSSLSPVITQRNNRYNVTQFYACAIQNEINVDHYLAGSQDNGTQLFKEDGLGKTTEATGGDGAFCFINQNNSDIQISSYIYNNYYVSTDGGNSFQGLGTGSDEGKFINPAGYDSDADILYTSKGTNTMGRYSNVSATVFQKDIELDLGNQSITHVSISPYTDNRIFIGTNGGVYRVDNANTTPTITKISGFDIRAYVSCIAIGASDDQLLVTQSNYGVVSVFETRDGGENWNNKEGGLPDIPVRWALYNPNNYNQALLATELGIWSSDNLQEVTTLWEPSVEGLANVRCDMIKYRSSDNQVVVATFGRGLFTSNVFTTGKYVSFKVLNNPSYENGEVLFRNRSIGEIDKYLWDLNNGNISTEIHAKQKYETAGSYAIRLYADAHGSDYNFQKEIQILPLKTGAYPISDGGDFENDHGHFYVENVSGTKLSLGKTSIEGKSGTASGDNAWVFGINEAQYKENSLAYLYTPSYLLLNPENYTLKFKSKFSFETSWDGFVVEYTTDNGQNWYNLGSRIGNNWYTNYTPNNSAFGNRVPIFSGNTDNEFKSFEYNLNEFDPNSTIGFRFKIVTDSYTNDIGMVLDDFELNGPAEAIAVDFKTGKEESQSCTGKWIQFYSTTTGNGINSYNWDFGQGATPATAEGIGPHNVYFETEGQKSISLTVNDVHTKEKDVAISFQSETLSVLSFNSEVCYGQDVIFTIANSDPNLFYVARENSSGKLVSGYVEGNGGNLDISVPNVSTDQSIYIESKDLNGSCSPRSATMEITLDGPSFILPTAFSSTSCDGSAVSIELPSSQAGVVYSVINSNDGTTMSDTYLGTGNALIIQTHPLFGMNKVALVAKMASGDGCSLVLQEKEVTPIDLPDPEIVYNSKGSKIKVNSYVFGSRFQWYLDDQLLEGQTSFDIYPEALGIYTVEVSKLNCSKTSAPFAILVQAIEDNKQEVSTIYPNPVVDIITIEGLYESNNTLTIIDGSGKGIVIQKNVFNWGQKSTQINLSSLKKGIYFLVIENEQGKETHKLIKK